VKEKIILGTVQLGLPYGINNTTGKPDRQQAFSILDLAYENGITALDTADNYGEALQVIGDHRRSSGKDFTIINKFKIDSQPLIAKLQASLSTLHRQSIACYMYHQFSDYHAAKGVTELKQLKQNKLIQSIGVSVYSNDELKEAVEDPRIDIIQLPVNILDLPEEKQVLLKRAKENGKEIHARSVFLQGLIMKSPDSLQGNLVPLTEYLNKLHAQAAAHGVSAKKLALNYVLGKSFIDKVVLGIEQAQQLKEILGLIDTNFANKAETGIEVSKAHTNLLNPVNWKI
jgi:uncharacterized protein